MLKGITRARKASKAHLGSHVEALQAWVQDLESAAITRDGYTQEEIDRALGWERELW